MQLKETSKEADFQYFFIHDAAVIKCRVAALCNLPIIAHLIKFPMLLDHWAPYGELDLR